MPIVNVLIDELIYSLPILSDIIEFYLMYRGDIFEFYSTSNHFKPTRVAAGELLGLIVGCLFLFYKITELFNKGRMQYTVRRFIQSPLDKESTYINKIIVHIIFFILYFSMILGASGGNIIFSFIVTSTAFIIVLTRVVCFVEVCGQNRNADKCEYEPNSPEFHASKSIDGIIKLNLLFLIPMILFLLIPLPGLRDAVPSIGASTIFFLASFLTIKIVSVLIEFIYLSSVLRSLNSEC